MSSPFDEDLAAVAGFVGDHALEIEALLEEIVVSPCDADEPPICFANALVRQQLITNNYRSAANIHHSLVGSGSALDASTAVLLAIVEAYERHALFRPFDQNLETASATELGDGAIDLDSIPRCSSAEIASKRCRVVLPDKTAPIRWKEGLTLNGTQRCLIPAVMVYTNCGWLSHKERFWLPISTGAAAHFSYEEAVYGAICEVIERDMIAITWLQLLSLPRITVDHCGPLAKPYWEQMNAFAHLEVRLFDATSDMRVPTIYAVARSAHHPRASTIVACSAAASYDRALAKVLRDVTVLRRGFSDPVAVPKTPEECVALMDGAAYMGRPEKQSAFDFLWSTTNMVTLSDLNTRPSLMTSLPLLTAHLQQLDQPCYVVDLTTPYADSVGLTVVKAVMPHMQPMSVNGSAKFKATPRLYALPERLGFHARSEAELNADPQPFA